MDDDEAYLLLLLSDSNLPTGSFVASAGLESYVAHGFFSPAPSTLPLDKVEATMVFVRDSLATYARSALPFVSDTHQAVEALLKDATVSQEALDRTMDDLKALDCLYEAMTLNHVARRASKSQGVALLTLFSKGFSLPLSLRKHRASCDLTTSREARAGTFVDKLKLEIRRENTHGHLPICWGVLTAALGLPLERSQSLHLFLHARSLLSASVRLNTVGPYAAQQLLLHVVRPLVDAEAKRCEGLRTSFQRLKPALDSAGSARSSAAFDETMHGPAVTWPLGEILAARHDLQHSRIFNS
ncbi:urease accessory protein UreF [Wolfiporia cocos MD-104 SS10]|uniref:Urease accessory protein UreF n=1 Tax=Wolfiporia cocos (strain MD-104) TaxID=742152 RepID=A0A2H3JF36_WOLCO|nr:urease accessory protein UreF [Wolfiporia cocos MD-104 SS10]